MASAHARVIGSACLAVERTTAHSSRRPVETAGPVRSSHVRSSSRTGETGRLHGSTSRPSSPRRRSTGQWTSFTSRALTRRSIWHRLKEVRTIADQRRSVRRRRLHSGRGEHRREERCHRRELASEGADAEPQRVRQSRPAPRRPVNVDVTTGARLLCSSRDGRAGTQSVAHATSRRTDRASACRRSAAAERLERRRFARV